MHGIGYEPVGDIEPVRPAASADPAERDRLVRFLRAGALASNARLLAPDEEHAGWHILGDPTEGALLIVGREGRTSTSWPSAPAARKVREFPFDSARKLMTAIRDGLRRHADRVREGRARVRRRAGQPHRRRRHRPADHGCRSRGVPRDAHREVRPRSAQSRLRDPTGDRRGRRDDRPGIRRERDLTPARARLDGRPDPRGGARGDAPGAGCPHQGQHRHGRLLAHRRGDRPAGGARPRGRHDDRDRRRTARDER